MSSGYSNSVPVGSAGSVIPLTAANQMINKSGYLYIYVSNETPNIDVFFDQLQVSHIKGPLIEDNTYYLYGLLQAGISDKNFKASAPDCGCGNKKGFNGNEIQNKEFSDGSGLEVYDFNARTYDQQIGRFLQIDPLPEDGDQESLTPYQFGLNNPIRNNDPDGKCPICPFIAKFLVGALVEYGSQVYDNYKSGKSGLSVLKPQSVGKILLNGATSVVDPSGGVVKKIAINTGTNIVESVGGQMLDGNGVTLNKTFSDVAVMTVSANVKIDGSGIVKKLEQKAEKLERTAINSTNKSGRNATQALEAKAKAQNANLTNVAAETGTTETTESVLGKKADRIFFGGNGNSAFSTPIQDNTYVKKGPVYKL